jgi:RNA polymerase sigma-70 factor (ECF subfamily)
MDRLTRRPGGHDAWSRGRVNEDELERIRKAQAGDAQALDWIVRTQWERVQRLLLRVWGPRQDLEDLVQTTFLETLRSLPAFRRDSELSTFVSGIAIRVARRARRPSLVRRHSVPLEAVKAPLATGSAPDHRAHDAEALRRVHTLLEALAEPKRVAFLLWALEGMSPAQIAEGMGASVPATRSRIFYAQRELAREAERDPYLGAWLTEVGDGERS